ncbi:MAG: hypothetical protein U0136_17325 [Bdellovibrionota bacterium]
MPIHPALDNAIAKQFANKIRPVLIADYSDIQTFDEVIAAIQAQVGRVIGIDCGAVRPIPTEALFDVNHAALEILKRGFAPTERRPEVNFIFVNVAKIDDTLDHRAQNGDRVALEGVRDDLILLAVLPDGSLVLSFSDHASPIFAEILPYVTAIAKFKPLPADLVLLKDLNFRSRDFLPRLAARILRRDAETLNNLEFVKPDQAAAKFEIVPTDIGLTWFVDTFGRHQNAVNIKTGFSVQQVRDAGINFGDPIELGFGDGERIRAVFHRSCSRLGQWQVGLVGSSSGVTLPDDSTVQYLDIMVKGAAAWPLFEDTAYVTTEIENSDGVKIPVQRKQPLGIYVDGELVLGGKPAAADTAAVNA